MDEVKIEVSLEKLDKVIEIASMVQSPVITYSATKTLYDYNWEAMQDMESNMMYMQEILKEMRGNV